MSIFPHPSLSICLSTSSIHGKYFLNATFLRMTLRPLRSDHSSYHSFTPTAPTAAPKYSWSMNLLGSCLTHGSFIKIPFVLLFTWAQFYSSFKTQQWDTLFSPSSLILQIEPLGLTAPQGHPGPSHCPPRATMVSPRDSELFQKRNLLSLSLHFPHNSVPG